MSDHGVHIVEGNSLSTNNRDLQLDLLTLGSEFRQLFSEKFAVRRLRRLHPVTQKSDISQIHRNRIVATAPFAFWDDAFLHELLQPARRYVYELRHAGGRPCEVTHHEAKRLFWKNA